jgi:hypothetical protein
MKARIIHFAVAVAIAAAPLGASALGTNEKGCLVGGAAGGLVGHTVSGNRTLLGAAIGCGAGVLINKERVKKKDEEARKQKVAEHHAYRHDENRRDANYYGDARDYQARR